MQSVTYDYKDIHSVFRFFTKLYYDTSETCEKPKLLPEVYPKEFKPILDMFDDYGYEFNFKFIDLDMTPVKELPQTSKTVVICVSGGKDSAATILHYKQHGYRIYLYHMKGINKCYPDEWRRVQEIAEYLDVPLHIDEVKLKGNHMYTEHPLKNYILVNGALNYAVANGITTTIALGDFSSATLYDNVFEISGGDCVEMWDIYKTIIQKIIPTFRLETPLHDVSDSLTIVGSDHELLKLSQSCLGTFRFREHKRKYNMDKYNVNLYPHRCGSCWKCAVEYLYYADHDTFEFNEDYYKYCLDVLLRYDKVSLGSPHYSVYSLWDAYLFYPIEESKIYGELKDGIIQYNKIKYPERDLG